MSSWMDMAPGAVSPEVTQRYTADPRSPALKGLFAYWKGKCVGGDLPARRDIDPVEIGALLPHVVLIDVLADPERYRARLVGTHIVQYLGRDHTGAYYDEVYSPAAYDQFRAGVRMAVRGRLAASSHGRVYFADGYEHLVYESLTLPLSTDGLTVDMLLMGLHVGVPPFERA